MRVKKINLTRMSHSELLGFLTNIWEQIEDISTRNVEVARNKARLQTSIYVFDGALRPPIKTALTPKIQAVDRERKQYWHTLKSEVKGKHKLKDTAAKEIAQRMSILFKTYGSLYQGSSQDRNARIENLLQDIHRKFTEEEIDKVNVTQWITGLQETNTEYKELIAQRIEEKKEYRPGEGLRQRKAVLEQYYSFVEFLNTYARNFSELGEIIEIIECINDIIYEFKPILKARHTRRENKKEEEREEQEE